MIDGRAIRLAEIGAAAFRGLALRKTIVSAFLRRSRHQAIIVMPVIGLGKGVRTGQGGRGEDYSQQNDAHGAISVVLIECFDRNDKARADAWFRIAAIAAPSWRTP
jgi:hypothetical protein